MEQVLSKRPLEDQTLIDPKRARWGDYYITLEGESPRRSSDTESIQSLQGKETDLAQDTSDTDTKSECDSNSSDTDIYEVEYEVASLSGDDDPIKEDSSSGSDDMLVKVAVAAAICNSSMEAWITDVEDSDTSLDETGSGQGEFWTYCIQCKSQNNNPRFRYCDKCFQARKTLFPPRPRGHRPRKKKDKEADSVKVKHPVALDNLRSCLSGLSQDSGIGSSQELCKLNLEEIVVPQHLRQNLPMTSVPTSTVTRKRTVSDGSDSLFSDTDVEVKKKKKLDDSTTVKKASENSENEVTSSVKEESKGDNHVEEALKEGTDSESVLKNDLSKDGDKSTKGDDTKGVVDERDKPRGGLSEMKELCITCNTHPKNSIFLHGSTGHMCCCYRCAVRTWHTIKSCPICKSKVQNVVKVFVYS